MFKWEHEVQSDINSHIRAHQCIIYKIVFSVKKIQFKKIQKNILKFFYKKLIKINFLSRKNYMFLRHNTEFISRSFNARPGKLPCRWSTVSPPKGPDRNKKNGASRQSITSNKT